MQDNEAKNRAVMLSCEALVHCGHEWHGAASATSFGITGNYWATAAMSTRGTCCLYNGRAKIGEALKSLNPPQIGVNNVLQSPSKEEHRLDSSQINVTKLSLYQRELKEAAFTTALRKRQTRGLRQRSGATPYCDSSRHLTHGKHYSSSR